MPFCSHCGVRVPDEASHCPGCGAPVAKAASAESETPSALSIDPGMTDQVQQHARAGRKIQAIKEYRQQTGAGLKEAKEAVERWLEAEGISSPGGAGCATSILILTACAGAGWLSFL